MVSKRDAAPDDRVDVTEPDADAGDAFACCRDARARFDGLTDRPPTVQFHEVWDSWSRRAGKLIQECWPLTGVVMYDVPGSHSLDHKTSDLAI